MAESKLSYRRILESAAIVGSASIVNILMGLLRTKMVAVLLGPAGIGLLSLYASLMSAASAVAGMGVNAAGTRQIAEAFSKEDERAQVVVRRAMFWGTFFMASVGAVVIFASRDILAVQVLGGAEHSIIVSWLALGVALAVASASQGAVIQGMRRIGDMARLNVYSSTLNTVFGVGLVWYWGSAGLGAYMLIGPLVSFVLGYWYVSHLPELSSGPIAVREITHQWQTLLRLGVPLMGAGVFSALVQLWIRIEVGNTFGPESLGHFQAAWVISMQYLSFVLVAMAADFYPRLTGVIDDHEAATRLVNEQTEVALLLSAPVLIAMIGLAAWVIPMLYSMEFYPAVEVLRWQLLGDVLKVASWPLSFVILASGAGKTFFLTEALALTLMGGLIAGLSSSVGLRITGIAFLACYLVYLPLVYWIARRKIGFRWQGSLVKLIVTIFSLCLGVMVVSSMYWWGAAVAAFLSLAFSFFALLRISNMSDLNGSMAKLGVIAKRIFG